MAGAGATARLGPDERAAALAELTRTEHQVLVIGGGVVGAGVALDAATRGLSVGLVEARDFGSGTSSRSSKLIHGGLRYLEQLNVGLVKEALAERSLLLQQIAPHLVRPVSFLFPFSHHVWERAYVGTGVTAYDLLGFSMGRSRGPAHPSPAVQARRAAAGARAQAVRLHRGAAVLGRAGGRRPLRDDAGPDRGRVRRPGGHPHPGDRLPAGRRAGDRGPCRGPGVRDRAGDPRPAGGQRHRACGPTRSRPWSAAAASSTSAPPRACTWSCPGTGSSRPPGSSCVPRSVSCLSSPGGGTGSSGRPTPTGPWTGRTRRPAGPTSTTSSARRTGSWPSR